MPDGTINKTIHIAAPPETVWNYLTNAAELGRWFHKPDANLASGEAFHMRGKDGGTLCQGEVAEMTPFTRLAYSFTAGPMNGLMTRVEWTLTAVDGGTRLSLVHTGFPVGADMFGLLAAFDKGWDSHLLRMRE